MTRPLHVLFSAPAYRPAPSFGGPIEVFTRLAEGMTVRGYELDVFTTSLTALDAAGSLRSRVETLGGVSVHYLATPVHFRWMGLTPTLPLHLERTPRPDVAHVFGFRDPIGTGVATWCRMRTVPYVFEGLGMVAPKHRKVLLKRALDSTLYRRVMRGATLVVAASTIEAQEYLSAGISEERIVVRPHGFPEVVRDGRRRELRDRLAVGDETPLVLYVGRIAHGKGIELLVQIAAQLQDVHVAVVGPDGGHGVENELRALTNRLRVKDRVHFVGPLSRSDLPNTYADADVFVLPSSYENFGMVAAEAAAAGAPVVLTDRCGVAECFDGRGALVVPYDEAELRDALSRLLGDAELRRRLGDEAREVAARWSWSRVLALQEDIYRRALGNG